MRAHTGTHADPDVDKGWAKFVKANDFFQRLECAQQETGGDDQARKILAVMNTLALTVDIQAKWKVIRNGANTVRERRDVNPDLYKLLKGRL